MNISFSAVALGDEMLHVLSGDVGVSVKNFEYDLYGARHRQLAGHPAAERLRRHLEEASDVAVKRCAAVPSGTAMLDDVVKALRRHHGSTTKWARVFASQSASRQVLMNRKLRARLGIDEAQRR